MQHANSVYDQDKPWQSMQENQISARMAAQTHLTTAQIQAIRPPIPNQGRTPARFGYGEPTQPTIDDVLRRMDKRWPMRRIDYTGTQAGVQSTSYPALGVM